MTWEYRRLKQIYNYYLFTINKFLNVSFETVFSVFCDYMHINYFATTLPFDEAMRSCKPIIVIEMLR